MALDEANAKIVEVATVLHKLMIDTASAVAGALRDMDRRIVELEKQGEARLIPCTYEYSHAPHLCFDKGDYRQCPGRDYSGAVHADADTHGRT